MPDEGAALASRGGETLDWRPALEALRGAYAERTIAEGIKAFRCFERWCEGAGLTALPAAPETLAAYLDQGFSRYALRTLRAYLHHIRRVHELVGAPDPTRSGPVKLAYRRGLRLKGARVRQAQGLTQVLREKLLAACDDSLVGRRDRALISVGYDTLCRRSELVALRLENLTPLSDGTARIRIERSKTDPFREGRAAYLSAAGLEVARRWIEAAELQEGWLLRPVFGSRAGEAQLHPKVVNRRIKLAAQRAGLAPEVTARLSGHSLRVGAAQDLAIAGRSLLQIMRAGRWRDPRVVAHYVREADVNIWSQGSAPDPALG